MQISLHRVLHGVLAIGLTAAVTSCVDNDYDLSKDIDLNVSVGGDLGLPSSNTENYSLEQILDLSPTSSIQPNGEEYGLADGDYVLVQNGNRTSSSVEIPRQEISNLQGTPASVTVPFVKPSNIDRLTVDIDGFSTRIALSDNSIDKAVESITSASTQVRIRIALTMNSQDVSGSVAFEPGFTVEFPAACTLQAADQSLAEYCTVSGNKITFTKERKVNMNSTLTLPILITKIDMTRLPQGQGLYAPGKFKFDQEITYKGAVTVDASGMAAGQASSLQFLVTPTIESAQLTAVTGKINPDIHVNASSFAINDIPDFLREPGNNLDVENPQIYLTVTNTSECGLNVNASLTAVDENGKTTEVWLGSEHATDPIIVKPYSAMPGGVTRICISRTGRGDGNADVYVAVPDLSSLIATIPQSITMDNIGVKVSQDRDVTFELGRYDFDVDYKVVVPLAFGPDLEFTYTTDEAGWDEDLEKYNFKTVVATIQVENTAPLDMVPEVKALDRQGNVINDVTASVEGTVLAGTLAAPQSSKLVVTLTSNAANIGNLDGVRFVFRARSGSQAVGVPLNKNQSLRFTDIRLKLKGGVSVDLN